MDYFFAVLMLLSGVLWIYVTGVNYLEDSRYYPRLHATRRQLLIGVSFAVAYGVAATLAALRGLLG